MSGDKTSPLAGVRVIDMATVRGEMAGRALADMGAEVLKIEPPQGTPARFEPPFIKGREGSPEGSLYWAALGRGKRSIVVDTGKAPERAQLIQLIAGADILIESFDPGHMKSLGMDYAAMKSLNPGLIYVSITPFGQTGPFANDPATSLTVEAACGLINMQGDGDRPPLPVGFAQAPFHAGMVAAGDALIALNERLHSGLGQHLDVSMQTAMMLCLMNASFFPPAEGRDIPGYGMERALPRPPLTPGLDAPSLLDVADGYVTNLMATFGPTIRTLGEAVKWRIEAEGPLPASIPDIDWNNWPEERKNGRISIEQVNEAAQIALNFLRKRTKQEIFDRALKHSMLNAPVNTTADLLEDPQLASRDFWVQIDGRTHPRSPIRLSRSKTLIDRPAPRLGEGQQILTAPARASAAPKVPASPRGKPFAGIKIADFAWVGVGPLISRALADNGATVVRMESATRPDTIRMLAPYHRREFNLNSSVFMANFNTSKYGMALNMSLEEGRAIAREMAGWADVMLESFTPGTIGRFGLDYETLSKDRPDLIMLSTCLYGQTGPRRHFGGYGNQGAAIAGLHGITGWPDRPPAGPYGAYTDFITPRFGVVALAAALYERSKSGKGQYVDLAQVEAGIQYLEPLLLDYTVNRNIARPFGIDSISECPHGVYQTAGIERYVAISVASNVQWRALCQMAGFKQFSDARFDHLSARMEAREEIQAAMRAFCSGKPPFHFVTQLRAAGVPAAVVMRGSDLYEDPQLVHRGYFVTLTHSLFGPILHDGYPTLYSDTPVMASKSGPVLGEDTDFVMKQILRYPEEKIERLKKAGVFV
jgi:crotonobetainyl-CoA:carnitine CoA-transferase CaiB-like acyl-CoA transferase